MNAITAAETQQDRLANANDNIFRQHGSMLSHPILKAFGQAEYGQIKVKTPEGYICKFIGKRIGPVGYLELHSWNALDALMTNGENGFAESYMKGEWDSPDLPALLTFGLANASALEKYFYGNPLYALYTRVTCMLRGNGLKRSRRNIMQHYDLGNDFYKLWLDKSMTYSCGLFGSEVDLSLEEAQQAKYRRIINRLGIRPGDHVLEIGCGWGGFAEAAGKMGVKVTAITLSAEQKLYADSRMVQKNLDGLVTIEMKDYREIEGQYDHIVSIGMFEHVGGSQWPAYFKTLRSRLKKGGKAMVQSITIDHEVFERTRGKYGFIEQYIFPGGMLPSKPLFRKAAEEAGLVCSESFAFGHDYALTVSHWLNRFNAHEKEIRLMGYDDSFIRLWRMYLSSCIASFTTGRTDVMQAELQRGE